MDGCGWLWNGLAGSKRAPRKPERLALQKLWGSPLWGLKRVSHKGHPTAGRFSGGLRVVFMTSDSVGGKLRVGGLRFRTASRPLGAYI